MYLLNNLPEKKLTWDEERDLLARRNDRRAAEKLILHNLSEAVIYAKHFDRLRMFSDGELMSLCYDVLKKSVPRFKSKYGIRFFAFTKNRIRGAVKRHWSTREVVKNAGVNREDYDGTPTFVVFTGGSDLHVSRGLELEETETCVQGGVASFDFGVIQNNESRNRIWATIKSKLNPRQQMMVILVYLCGFNMQDAGRLLGISRSAVQATHAAALEILRDELSDFRELLIGKE